MHWPKKSSSVSQIRCVRGHLVEEGQHQVLVRTDMEGGTLHVTNLRGHEKQGVIMWKVESRTGRQVITQVYGGRRCVATASRIAKGSGKDRDSFGFDFRVVAAIIFPPWGPLPGPAPSKLQSSIIQLLPLQSCHRAHSLIIPVFSLQTEGPISGAGQGARCWWHLRW